MSSAKKHPWFKFDADAWGADPHLRMCSPAAHGLLINLMAIAHGADPYGFIVNGDLVIDQHNMGKVMAWNRQTVGKAWAELEQHGRIVLSEVGSWYIPRMVRDYEQAIIDSKNGSKGGNPKLVGVNPPINPDKNKSKKEKENKSKNPQPPKGASDLDGLPDGLQDEIFRASWSAWCQHRRESRKALTATTRASQLAKLEKMGTARAIKALSHSIEGGYQGIFEPSPDRASTQSPTRPANGSDYLVIS